MKAVLKALVNQDGTLNKEAFRFVPPGVISTCLNKAIPDGAVLQTEEETPGIIIRGFVPVEGYEPELI